jgi:hypothetical protein
MNHAGLWLARRLCFSHKNGQATLVFPVDREDYILPGNSTHPPAFSGGSDHTLNPALCGRYLARGSQLNVPFPVCSCKGRRCKMTW